MTTLTVTNQDIQMSRPWPMTKT